MRMVSILRRFAGAWLAPEIAVSGAVVIALWLGLTVDLWQSRATALAGEARDGRDLALAAEANVSQAIAMVDQTLLALQADYDAAPRGNFDLQRWVRIRYGATPAFRLAINPHIGRSGEGLAIANTAARNDPFTLRFSRSLGDGSEATLSVDPRWLSHIYAALDDGTGFFLLAGPDGTVLAGAPTAAASPGDRADAKLLAALDRTQPGATDTATRPLGDGITRILAARRLAPTGLLLVVGQDEDRALADWRSRSLTLLLGASLLTAAILAAGLLLQRRRAGLLAAHRELFDAVENISQGIILTDAAGRIALVNRRAIELCGGERTDAHALGGPLVETISERAGANGAVLEVRTRPLANGGAVRTLTDITAHRQADEAIRRLAHYDPLTGLANRHKLRDDMEAALAQRDSGGPQVALIFLDLDRFKAVNDTLGHAAGDAVLREVAARLRAGASDAEVIARVGGDEFVVVQAGPPQPDGSMALAHRLVERVSEPYDIAGQPVTIGTSIGIALPRRGESIDRLLGNADFALYAAKSAGRGTVRLFDSAMRAEFTGQRELVQDLSDAIAAGRIEVHYQPVFATGTGEAVAFEALARWTHPVHGPVPPSTFIPLAEANGLIHALSRDVLAQACATAATWPERYRLVVNLSPDQIGVGNLAKTIGDELRRNGLAASRLELEIKERALIERTEQALAVFRGLRSLGVQVSLDDFGTGYSSLAYLRLFPFNRIKIDGRFIRALDSDPATGTVVQAIIGMGRTMQIKVAADGVENETQLAILRQQRCGEVQGHFLGHPGPASTLGRFMAGERVVRRESAKKEAVLF